uniref:Uncharacterized protein n=1 Tax=Anguilla anguilla TaxID=7936 RepID=A0A0E9RMQ9_ANGAN
MLLYNSTSQQTFAEYHVAAFQASNRQLFIFSTVLCLF